MPLARLKFISLDDLFDSMVAVITGNELERPTAIVIEGGTVRKGEIVSLAIRLNDFLFSSGLQRNRMEYKTNPLVPPIPDDFLRYLRSSVVLNQDLLFFVYDYEERLSSALEKDGDQIYSVYL